MKKRRKTHSSSLWLTSMLILLGVAVLMIERQAARSAEAFVIVGVRSMSPIEDESLEGAADTVHAGAWTPGGIVTRPPDSGDAQLEAGLAQIQIQLAEGKLDEGMALANALVASHPFEARCHFFLGLAHSRKKSSREAIRCYRKAVDLFPNYQSALYNLGTLHQRRDEHDSAIYYLTACIELEGSPTVLAKAHAVRAHCLREWGDQEGAIADYLTSLRLRPESLSTWRYLAITQAMDPAGWNAAMDTVERLLEKDPTYVRGINLKGELLRQRGRFHAAKITFNQTLQLEPNNEEALWELALIDWHDGSTVSARKHLRKLVSVVRSARERAAYEAMLAIQEQDFATARQRLDLAFGSDSLRSLRLHVEACLERQLGRSEESRRLFTLLLDQGPDEVYLLEGLADALLNLKDDQAGEVTARLLALSPDNPAAWLHRGRYHRSVGDVKAAEVAFNTAISKSPRGFIRREYADFLIAADRLEGAQHQLDALSPGEAKRPETRLIQARLHRMENRTDEALRLLDQLASNKNLKLKVLSERAELMIQQGKHSAALDCLTRAVDGAPGRLDYRIRKTRLLAYMNRDDAALQELSVVFSLNDSHPEAIALAQELVAPGLPESAESAESDP